MAVNRATSTTPRTTTTTSTGRTPTKKQLEKRYADFIDAQTAAGKLKKLAKAPTGGESADRYDVSRGALGLAKHAVIIKGEIYLRTKPVRPNAEATWFHAGKAPTSSTPAAGGTDSSRAWTPSSGTGGRGRSGRSAGGEGSTPARAANGRRS